MEKALKKNTTLAIISGLALIPGWYEWGTGLTLLVAFIPLFILAEKNSRQPHGGRAVFLNASLAFFIWNLGTTWWIKNAQTGGKDSYAALAAAVVLSMFFMAIAFWLAFKAWQFWGRKVGLFAMVVFWLAFEFSYTHGEVSWPWLTLGNGFIYEVKLIQWYDITGAMGGSLWVLMVNVLIFSLFVNNNKSKSRMVAIALVVVMPIAISIIRYYTYEEETNPRKIIVVQPNIDPYLKFKKIPSLEQANIQIREARALLDSTVDYVVAPETSIMDNIWLNDLNSVPAFHRIKSLVKQFPKIKYVVGIMCYQVYLPGEKLSATARPLDEHGKYYDSYNSAIQIDSTDSMPIYHKSKLVIGVETMPYPELLKFLEPVMMHLGGTFRSHNVQKERSVLSAPNDSLSIGTPICYESVYGEFVTEFVKKGAGLLFVLTNDGWWDDTPGYRQHNALSSIRAIETRRSIARSANTGISSFINQRGEVQQKLGWWERGGLIGTLNVSHKLTFYVKYGDYIGRGAFFMAIIMVLSLVSKYLRNRTKRTKAPNN